MYNWNKKHIEKKRKRKKNDCEFEIYFSISVYFSIWYMSPSNREIGTLPIVSLKNSISMVDERMVRSEGSNSRRRPKRVGCRGYRSRTWSERIHCAWSCSISTGCTSQSAGVSTHTPITYPNHINIEFLKNKPKDNKPGEKRMTAFMQPTSLASGEICRNRHKISCTVFISADVAASFGIRSRTRGLSSSAPKSHGTPHCERFNKNSSFQDSCSKSCWSFFERVWKGTRHLTHRTAMNRRRAVVSFA